MGTYYQISIAGRSRETWVQIPVLSIDFLQKSGSMFWNAEAACDRGAEGTGVAKGAGVCIHPLLAPHPPPPELPLHSSFTDGSFYYQVALRWWWLIQWAKKMQQKRAVLLVI